MIAVLSSASQLRTPVATTARRSCCAESGPLDRAEVSPQESTVSPGVTDMRGTVVQVPFNADQAAGMSCDQALAAAAMGTFGVGGVLLGPHREVIAVAHNQVIKDGSLQDPTAHGERQLVDWYFQQAQKGDHLPAPSECTIITSLDPCMMCTGAILTAGFKVLTTALDDQAGVNFPADSGFRALPEELRSQAQDHFGYFGVEGARGYQGPQEAPFAGQSIRPETEKRSLDAFLGSLQAVRDQINHGAASPPDASALKPEVVARLRQLDPSALSLTTDPQRPGVELAPVLLRQAAQARSQGNAYDAAALLDAKGNLLLTVSGQESQSPTRTAFMELTRSWANLRRELGPENLPEFKNCKLVTLMGPGRQSTDVMELGAYGSSVEGPMPAGTSRHWQYVIARQDPQELKRMVSELPPLYSQTIRPDLEQVQDPALIQACQQENGQHQAA